MTTQIRVIPDDTGIVAAWGFKMAGAHPMQHNLALGVLDGETLKGVILFTGWNGSEAEIHFYGPGTLKRHVLVAIFKVAVIHLNLNRLTVRTRKASMARGVQKLGAIYECTLRRFYGPTDSDRDTAEQFVFFRERMAQIAGLKENSYVRT